MKTEWIACKCRHRTPVNENGEWLKVEKIVDGDWGWKALQQHRELTLDFSEIVTNQVFAAGSARDWRSARKAAERAIERAAT